MLVLTRKIGESFYIGEHAEVTVKVLTNDGYNIRLGIDAPQEVLIFRSELVSNKPSQQEKKPALEGAL